ncbi:hypothetical protein A5719_06430 [Mycolicibacterium peregrinum]|nr:hypothetical protein A5719_06430 [Mycolicibacterium peregrinum]
MLELQRHRDVLAVYEQVHQPISRCGADRGEARADRAAQLFEQLMIRTLRCVAGRGIADHSVEAAARSQQIDQYSTDIGLCGKRQVGHDVSNLPPLTQAGVAPLRRGEWFE